jgi:BirA family biotin operon repressor/biotin-[acetyl-CoA-carboxylase] ligase
MIFGNKDSHHEPNQVIKECKSTNDIVKDFGRKNFPHATWIASETQKSGRGRMGREWVSQKGNLHLSILLRVQDLSFWTWIPLLTAVSIAEVLEKRFPSLEVQIKWPNDLSVSGAKLGGILVESVSEGANRFLVVGIGLNCLLVPEVKDRKVTSLSSELGKAIHATEILDDIRFWVSQRTAQISKLGREELKSVYSKYSFHKPGDAVEWQSRVGKFSGVFVELGDQGEFIIETQDQKRIRLLSEELSV